MKLIFKIALFAAVFASTPVCGETYQWTDDDGSIHFSDNASSIPKKSKNKVRRIEDISSNTPIQSKDTNKPNEYKTANKTDDIIIERFISGSAEFIALERQLSDIWNQMRQSLRERRIEDALGFFIVSSRPSFRSQFNATREKPTIIADEMGDMRLVKVKNESFAECDLRRVENGKTYSFMLQFIRDYDGNWRIRTF